MPVSTPSKVPSFRLYVVTDRRVTEGTEGLVDRLVQTANGLPAGTMAVEVREKDLGARELLTLVCRLREALGPTGVPVIVNDRWDVAAAAGAEGVHLPESSLDPAVVRLAWRGLVGVSTHSVQALQGLDGADFATFGPVFATPSKLAYGPPQGVARLREATAASPVPVYAIGGIDVETAPLLKNTGIAGIALIRAVLAAKDPAAAARQILEQVFPATV